MPAEGPPSEFGGKIQPNTVYPKGPDALTANDKLRLVYRTGQDETSVAEVDDSAFQGGTYVPGES